MPDQTVSPYGSWKSPITSDLIVADSVGLSALACDGDDIYWTELRPRKAGRYVLVAARPMADQDITPARLQRAHPRARVRRRRLYVNGGPSSSPTTPTSASTARTPASEPRPITPDGDAHLRYADATVDRPTAAG